MNRKPEEGQKVRLNNYGIECMSKFYDKKINEKVKETIFTVLSVTKPTYLDHYGLWYVKVNNDQLNRCELNSLFFDAID
jgi:hypothetical protein